MGGDPSLSLEGTQHLAWVAIWFLVVVGACGYALMREGH